MGEMMKSVVIVALPEEQDEVNKVSSEKVAHMTLLNLGDLSGESSIEQILEHVEHVASLTEPFWLDIDYRGELGDDKADVLFFAKRGWSMPTTLRLRSSLLLNNRVKLAYDSAEQFPEWTPHVTLGYPDSPASEPEGKLYNVRFDRIAVWVGDYEGPTFRLEHHERDLEVAMSDMQTLTEIGEAAVEELLHYGVPGMKWGVRKTEADGSPRQRGKVRSAMTKAGDATVAGAKVSSTSKNQLKAAFLPDANRAAVLGDLQGHMLGAAIGMRKDPRFAGKDIKYDAKLRETYRKEMESIAQTYYSQRLAEEYAALSVNVAVEGIKTVYDYRKKRAEIKYADGAVQHAEGGAFAYLDFEYDEKGFITEVDVTEGELKHYGVKGMRWGYTTSSDGTVSVNQTRVKKSLRKTDQPVKVIQRKAGTYVKAKGGQRQTATEDAIKTQAARQKAKRSTTDSLSTKELKDTIERMRLEQEFAKLDKKVSRKGKGFVAKLLESDISQRKAEDLLKKATAPPR